MTKILSDNLIVPSMTVGYNATNILQAVKGAVGATPMIGCESDRVRAEI